MKRASKSNALLLEVLIVVLFFALASTVLIRVFVGARSMSLRAGCETEAMMEAQNLAEQLYIAGTPEGVLTGEGFERTEEGWQKENEEAGYTLTVTLRAEDNAGSGLLRRGTVMAYTEQAGERRELLRLDCTRYYSGEEMP